LRRELGDEVVGGLADCEPGGEVEGVDRDADPDPACGRESDLGKDALQAARLLQDQRV